MAMEYATSKGILLYETSAKTGYNIEELFEGIARKMPMKEPQRSSLIDVSQQQSGSSCCK